MLMVDVYLRRESGGGEVEKKKIDDNSRMKNKFKNLLAHFFRHQKWKILVYRLFLKFSDEGATNRKVVFFGFSDFLYK